jgi:hypothetical protein
LFRYLAARLRHPGPAAKQYLRAGLGLERRAQHLATFWNDHLSRTRAAQARWARDLSGGLLTVLGAGPLLDFNAAALSPRVERFRLVDANPLCVDHWKRLEKPVEPLITDITNCLEVWLQALEGTGGSWSEVLSEIKNLSLKPKQGFVPVTDCLLSLNILSQLEVGWQESVEPFLKKRFGSRFVCQHEQEWLRAIQPSSRVLAEQHLAALEASRASDILLITDAEYVDYKGRKYSLNRWEALPVSWSEKGWQADPGIEFEVTPALEGLVIDGNSLTRWMPSYQVEWHDSWLWHISPYGTEPIDHGQIHRVVALSLRFIK